MCYLKRLGAFFVVAFYSAVYIISTELLYWNLLPTPVKFLLDYLQNQKKVKVMDMINYINLYGVSV